MNRNFDDSKINRHNAKEVMIPIAVNITKYIFGFVLIVGVIQLFT